ncbi:MAG: hypothetical protein SFY32_06340, partial [Bacteroidota bacterium]|nr:hypothetical protein [Bacteroidota bacterium]
MLELRLNELDSVVDKFVICEATYTHQGKDKPLYFEQNKHLFEPFLHKIIHVVSSEKPSGWEQNNWLLENKQRLDLKLGLKGSQQNDVVIISDLDEIPSAEKIKIHANEAGIKVLMLKNHYYFLNIRDVKFEGSLLSL